MPTTARPEDDLTKLAERSERPSLESALLASIVECSDDAIITKDLNGIVTSWNPAAERIFGYTAEEIIGRPIVTLIPPDRPNEEPAILERIRGGERVDHYETVRRRKDGARLDISVTISPIRDADGRIIGASKIARDITQQKRVEQQLRGYAEDLATQHRRKDEFLAMLAHELRNPLAAVLNTIQVLRTRDAGDPETERQHAVIERQSRQMARLLDDLLDVSRITRGKIELRTQVFDLRPLVEQEIEAARPLMDERGHRITVSLPREPLYVDADPIRIHQIMGNLLSNAAKYTPPGGKVAVAVARDGGRALLRVSDTGQGISPELLPNIFDLFVQDDRSIWRETGLGVGLTMVQRLAELHGGSVAAHSPGVGEGSDFTVVLPLAKGEPAPPDLEVAATPTRHPVSRRILIVDDNRDAAESLAEVAALWGHQVCTAHDGASALRAAEASNPEVILLDLSMPGMSGYEVAAALRQRPGGNGTVLVALTGYGQESDRRRTQEAGFDHHLIKPVDPQALRKLLENAGSTVRG